jgi:hypothetical protein
MYVYIAHRIQYKGKEFRAMYEDGEWVIRQLYDDGALCVVPGTRGKAESYEDIARVLREEVP